MHSHSLPTIINMKRFILLLLLTQCSFANELSSTQHKAELASLELMAEIKAEMALKLVRPPATECIFPEARILNREYHSSLRIILLDYEDFLNK